MDTRTYQTTQALNSEPISADDRDAAVIRLMRAARSLALDRYRRDGLIIRTTRCEFCGKTQPESDLLPGVHAVGCKVGGVLAAISDIETMAAAAADERARIAEIDDLPADVAVFRHCGPVCYGGAAHNARVEDGVFWRPELEQAAAAIDQADGFGEPWTYYPADGPGDCAVVRSVGREIVSDSLGTDLSRSEDERYMRRIAACVNVCAGIPTGQLEQSGGFPAVGAGGAR